MDRNKQTHIAVNTSAIWQYAAHSTDKNQSCLTVYGYTKSATADSSSRNLQDSSHLHTLTHNPSLTNPRSLGISRCGLWEKSGNLGKIITKRFGEKCIQGSNQDKLCGYSLFDISKNRLWKHQRIKGIDFLIISESGIFRFQSKIKKFGLL